MHEMPDLFKIGEWWYLITTEYSHASKQVYRMAKSLKGPWIAPEMMVLMAERIMQEEHLN